MFAVVLSQQLVPVLMFGVIFLTIINNLYQKKLSISLNLILTSLPAVIYFLVVYISGVMQSGFLNYSTNAGDALLSWTGFNSYGSMVISTAGLFLYCFSLILPLALFGMWRFRSLHFGAWLLFSIILMLLPIASVSPYRWVLMLTFPLAFFATDALSRTRSIKWKRYRFNLRRIAILYLALSTVFLSFGFIFMTSESPFPYFRPNYLNYYEYQIPSSMLQNTISKSDCADTSDKPKMV